MHHYPTMRQVVAPHLLAATILLAAAVPSYAAEPAPGLKLRVLVDKVLMRGNDWVMTEDHVREIADAGFNVVSPRIGGTDLARVRRVAEFARKHGIRYMAWMRGSLAATEGTRYTTADGTIQEIYSPNADELWDWMTPIILGQAELSLEIPSIVGVFLDYENYAPNRRGNCYSLSYDDRILAGFAQAQGISIPVLATADRRAWLDAQGLHEDFAQFQIRAWRDRCRTLRQQVDTVNPRFQFIVYPAPGTPFMKEAVCPEWATVQAPLILADATTYGRGSFLLTHRDALEDNRRKLNRNVASVRPLNIPFRYMGGIDPVVEGADPEFSGRNAVMIADVSDGYWIFYEGPTYGKPDHEAYWHWFSRANHAIADGQFAFQHEPRETPDPIETTAVECRTAKPQVAVYGMKPRMHSLIDQTGRFEVHEFRGASPEYLDNFDVVILQNFNVSLDESHSFLEALRNYVNRGGGVLFAHDTVWFMDSPFPAIAERAVPQHDTSVEAGRHVVDVDLVIDTKHPATASLEESTRFVPEFRDHMIFASGPEGAILIRNALGDAACVIGQHGNGRVVFSGSYYGYSRDLQGHERSVFLAILDWLAAQ